MYEDAYRLVMTLFFLPVLLLTGITGYLLAGTLGAAIGLGWVLLFVWRFVYYPK